MALVYMHVEQLNKQLYNRQANKYITMHAIPSSQSKIPEKGRLKKKQGSKEKELKKGTIKERMRKEQPQNMYIFNII